MGYATFLGLDFARVGLMSRSTFKPIEATMFTSVPREKPDFRAAGSRDPKLGDSHHLGGLGLGELLDSDLDDQRLHHP